MTRLSLTTTSAARVKVDAVVLGIAPAARKGSQPVLTPGGTAVEEAVGRQLRPTLAALGATGKAEQVTRLATFGAVTPAVVVAVGLGEGKPSPEALRRAAGAAVRALAGTATTVAIALTDPDEPDLDALRAVAEGALLGAYAFTAYRTTQPDDGRPVASVQLVVGRKVAKDPAVAEVVRRAEVVASAVHLVRDLVNTPPSDLHPADLAAVAAREAQRAGVTAEVIDHRKLAKGGFGGIVGVGQGSAHPPRLVHLAYRGGGPKVALVGKGVTFDSGGLSLKPATAMEEMKSDMGGAAAVIAATLATAELGLRVDVDAWVPMAENMPSGSAIRPSDVLTMYGGTTVEVNNTDAEGRLILADAITRACEDDPEILLDAATLTGAQLVALGARTAAVMGNDDALRDAVVDAGGRAGEALWPMPLPPDLKQGLDSDVADLQNTGPREGGMLTAGLFLSRFVREGVRWAHLDIAGPAFNSAEPYGYTPHGGTGAAVRTLVQVLEDLTRSAVRSG